ncbi:aspartate aminotransferase family protein [Klenkia terrae]|uniref:aspartate aminotransferase family protein n=1 Tax=Klenkia terrae TaxID=1052259 RepID=UPI003622E72F
MTTTEQSVTEPGRYGPGDMDNLWLHFSRMGSYTQQAPPVIVKGEGAYIWDDRGRKYLDGLAGLFVVQAGHGRRELAQAAAKQAEELAFFPIWSYAHPSAIELSKRLAAAAPGDLNRVFFTTGGGEAVETAWKAAKQYFKLVGKPAKHKVISRAIAYHGTTQGALSITGLPALKQDFEPLVPGAFRAANTNIYRAPYFGDDPKAFGQWAADQIEQAIVFEGPDTVAAVFLEPVQNAGGCFPPPPGYFERVREICDRHDVLLVSDEVICAFGRLGTTFACEKFGYVPDMITCAKGMTSGYSPIGAMIASDRVMEPFLRPGVSFPHGYTFGGHPVSSAVALANLDIFERRASTSTCWRPRARSAAPWRSCPICRSSATSAATASSTGSSWSRTRRPRRPSTTPRASGCCAGSSPGPCSTPGCTAGPTTAATRSSSWPRR